VIGYDESEQLDIEPARYFVRVTRREKRACRRCSTVTAGPLAERIIEKGLASDAVVINTVVAKYCNHLPLYRQAVMIEREARVEIGRATLDGWVMRVGELLGPVVGAMRRDLLAASYLQADETPVPVQMHDRHGENHQAYLWQYGKTGGETVFDFCLGRGREGPRKFLGQLGRNFANRWLFGLRRCRWAEGGACRMLGDARRKFVDALKVNPHDGEARAYGRVVSIDHDARRRRLSAQERQGQRYEYAKEWLNDMWAKLRRCFDHAEVELSNNLAENSIRPIALGRKNWLHVCSPQAGPKVAAILSVVESCRRIKAPLKEYLLDILPGIASRKGHRNRSAHAQPLGSGPGLIQRPYLFAK
jgi:transposase